MRRLILLMVFLVLAGMGFCVGFYSEVTGAAAWISAMCALVTLLYNLYLQKKLIEAAIPKVSFYPDVQHQRLYVKLSGKDAVFAQITIRTTAGIVSGHQYGQGKCFINPIDGKEYPYMLPGEVRYIDMRHLMGKNGLSVSLIDDQRKAWIWPAK